jgi:hypothetical protein
LDRRTYVKPARVVREVVVAVLVMVRTPWRLPSDRPENGIEIVAVENARLGPVVPIAGWFVG